MYYYSDLFHRLHLSSKLVSAILDISDNKLHSTMLNSILLRTLQPASSTVQWYPDVISTIDNFPIFLKGNLPDIYLIVYWSIIVATRSSPSLSAEQFFEKTICNTLESILAISTLLEHLGQQVKNSGWQSYRHAFSPSEESKGNAKRREKPWHGSRDSIHRISLLLRATSPRPFIALLLFYLRE